MTFSILYNLFEIDNISDCRMKVLRKYTLIWLFSNIPFIIYFYDYFNMNAIIMSLSNLQIGLNPYLHGSLIVAPLMMLPYDLMIYNIYSLTGFNLYFTVVIVKLISLFFTYISAVLIYKIVSQVSESKAKLSFIAFLFNPFIIFVNDVWVQPEFIPIFFITYALYIFIRRNREPTYGDVLKISMSLLIATLTFYFPIFLFPTFLVYSKKVRGAVYLLLTFISLSFVYIIIILEFHLSSTFINALASGSSSPVVYSIFSLFSFDSHVLVGVQEIVIFLLLILSFAVPLIFRKKGLLPYVPLFFILAITFILEPTGLNADAYVVIVPFLILCVVQSFRVFEFRTTFLLQVFLLVQFILVQIYNGASGVSGIFYWIYPFFPNSINLIRYVQNVFLLHITILMVYLVSLSADMTLFAWASKPEENKFSFSEGRDYPIIQKTKVMGKPIVIISFFLIAILVLSGVAMNNTAVSKDININSTSLPYMLFLPTINGYYAMPSVGTYQYSYNNNSFYFWSNANTVSLYRNVSSQSIYMKGIIRIYGNVSEVGANQIIFASSNITSGIAQDIFLPQNYSNLTPSTTSNTKNLSSLGTNKIGTYIHSENNLGGLSLANNSYVQYNSNYSILEGETIVFGQKAMVSTTSPYQIWNLTVGNISYVLSLNDHSLSIGYLTGASLVKKVFPISDLVEKWTMSTVTFVNLSTLKISFDSVSAYLPIYNIHPNSKISLSIGNTNDANKTKANHFMGEETNVIIVPHIINYLKTISFVTDSSNGALVISLLTNSSIIPFEEKISSAEDLYLKLGNTTLNSTTPPSYLAFGVLSKSYWPFSISFEAFSLSSTRTEHNYLGIVIDFGLILPAVVFVSGTLISELFREKR